MVKLKFLRSLSRKFGSKKKTKNGTTCDSSPCSIAESTFSAISSSSVKFRPFRNNDSDYESSTSITDCKQCACPRRRNISPTYRPKESPEYLTNEGSIPSRYLNLGPVPYARPFYEDLRLWMTNFTREEAEDSLKGKPNGTFLIRPSSTGNGQFAMSLVANLRVVHCIIYYRNGFYGFAEPFTHPDLVSLVQFYCNNTLEQHNYLLKTKLLFPIMCFGK